MGNLYQGKVYLEHQTNIDELPLLKVITINETTAHNPVKLALEAYGSVDDLDLLLLANNITDPYKQLPIGKLISVPVLAYANSETKSSSNKAITRQSIKLKQTAGSKKLTF